MHPWGKLSPGTGKYPERTWRGSAGVLAFAVFSTYQLPIGSTHSFSIMLSAFRTPSQVLPFWLRSILLLTWLLLNTIMRWAIISLSGFQMSYNFTLRISAYPVPLSRWVVKKTSHNENRKHKENKYERALPRYTKRGYGIRKRVESSDDSKYIDCILVPRQALCLEKILLWKRCGVCFEGMWVFEDGCLGKWQGQRED